MKEFLKVKVSVLSVIVLSYRSYALSVSKIVKPLFEMAAMKLMVMTAMPT